MAITIQHKRDTAANWTSNNPTLAAGEFGFETDTGKLKLGDGSTAWSSLGYFEPGAAAAAPYTFQGSTSGYTTGGSNPPARYDIIDKFPFSSDTNATDVGDSTAARNSLAGQTSSSHSYNSGGYLVYNTIEKFPFSTDTNATDVGDLITCVADAAGQSSGTSGYSSGGYNSTCSPTDLNIIQKFPVSSDSASTDVADLTVARFAVAGHSSDSNGYTSGGFPYPINRTIDKFPFSSDANATDVGDGTVCHTGRVGQSSDTHGYQSGGYQFVPYADTRNVIDKFSFSSDGNSTSVGVLSVPGQRGAGQSSTDNGYTSGAIQYTPVVSPTYVNRIDKFPFSSDGNATDVGDLTCPRAMGAGTQV